MNRNFNIIIFITITSLFFSCKEKNNLPIHPKEIIAVHETQKVDTANEKDYFNCDTLLIKKYVSDSGNRIELRGSQSKDLFSISINPKNGKKFNYKLTDNWYIAAHLYIVWDNQDYIFLRYGCGTECWGGRILDVKAKKSIQDYPFYLYTDSIKNFIVYPDTIDMKKIYFENIKTRKKKAVEFDLCEEAVMPILTIDTIFEVEEKKIMVRYTDKNCKLKKEKVIELN